MHRGFKHRPFIPSRLFPVLTITVILLMLYLLCYFTAPMTDESLPMAIGLRFLQGQKPFIDDLSPYIGLGLLVAPIIKLSLLIHNGKNELILFMRHAYLFFSTLVGIYTYISVRKYVPNILAACIALSIIIFHPFGINNFHYDTLGTLLWTAQLFQLYNFIHNDTNKITDSILYALINLTLCLSYPPFILMVISLNAIAFFYVTNKKAFCASQITVYTIASAFIAWVIFSFYGVKLPDILNTLQFNKNLAQFSAHQLTFFQKTSLVLINLFKRYSIHCLIASFLLTIAHYFKRSHLIQNLIFALTLTVPLLFIHLTNLTFTGIFYYLNSLGLTGGIIFFIYLRQHQLAKRISLAIWLPSFIAGLLTSVSSYNLELNFIIGFFPAVLSSLVFYYLSLKNINGNESAIPNIFIFFFISTLCYFQLSYIYDDEKRGLEIYTTHEQYQISGPLNHLYIEPKWIPILSSLQNDLNAIDTSDTTFIYFGPFSVGYLLVDKLKPGDYLAYCSYEVNHYGQKIRTPNYTVDLSKSLTPPTLSIAHYLADQNPIKYASHPPYDIYYSK